MTIGELASASGVPATTLRYYDRIGLLPAGRSAGGYRRYDPDTATAALRAIGLCRGLGVALPEIRTILAAPPGPSPVRTALARTHLERLEERMVEMHRARAALQHLVACTCPDTATCLAAVDAAAAGAAAR